MRHVLTSGFLLCLAITQAFAPRAAAVGDREVRAILVELNANPRPAPPLIGFKNEDDKKQYYERLDAIERKRAALVLELYRADPDHEALTTLMPERWQTVFDEYTDLDKLSAEITDVITRTKSDRLRVEGAFDRAEFRLKRGAAPIETIPREVDDFLKLAPRDARRSIIEKDLFESAPQKKRPRIAFLKEFAKRFPGTLLAIQAEGEIKRAEAIGKPFELEFDDAISGEHITMKRLRGEIVVIDFWATWSGPSVGHINALKDIYHKYHDHGVEFLGISLDFPARRGGLAKLREFVARNAIPWPQYFQGNAWQSEFSRTWGITTLPMIFVVDAKGLLRSTTAKDDLDPTLASLLMQSNMDSNLPLGAAAFDPRSGRKGERDADSILIELNENPLPAPPLIGFKNEDEKKQYYARLDATERKRAALILELYRADRDHEALTTLMPERWQTVFDEYTDLDQLSAEITDVVARTKSDSLRIEGAFDRAEFRLKRGAGQIETIPREVDDFLKLAPRDARRSIIEKDLYDGATKNVRTRIAFLKEFAKRFSGTLLAIEAEGEIKRAEAIGKPFELEFEDAISGEHITMNRLRGEIVVIDFWATWSGPSVGHINTLKDIYHKYHDRGVEFLGISLDFPARRGGLAKLREFVARNAIPWPQYFQGNEWQSEFSRKWGITTLPTIFVVDAKGLLRSTTANEDLDAVIASLFKESKSVTHAVSSKK